MSKKNNKYYKEVEVVSYEKETNKNFLIGIIIILLLGIFAFWLYHNKEANEQAMYKNSYLLSTGAIYSEINNISEISHDIAEVPNEYFVLINYTGDKNTYEFERELKSIIDEYKLSDSIFYLNVRNIMENDNYLALINNAFNTDIIKEIPIILYYKDDVLKETATSVDSFQKLLKNNDFKSQ